MGLVTVGFSINRRGERLVSEGYSGGEFSGYRFLASRFFCCVRAISPGPTKDSPIDIGAKATGGRVRVATGPLTEGGRHRWAGPMVNGPRWSARPTTGSRQGIDRRGPWGARSGGGWPRPAICGSRNDHRRRTGRPSLRGSWPDSRSSTRCGAVRWWSPA